MIEFPEETDGWHIAEVVLGIAAAVAIGIGLGLFIIDGFMFLMKTN